jgi:hypothetical protein
MQNGLKTIGECAEASYAFHPHCSKVYYYFVFVGVMYSGEYGVCDVTLSVHPHRASR